MATILVVDDEARIRDVVQYALQREGFEVVAVADGETALAELDRRPVDLVVLDILLPDIDGLSVCRRIRQQGSLASPQLPIIFLSSRTEEVDRILGLELGGDDYVTKPFSPRELAIRVKTVLRRTHENPRPAKAGRALQVGAVEIDVSRHEVRVRGEKISLTVTEFGVLQALLEQPGRLLTRQQLIDRAYSHDNVITERTIDTHVRRIRAKMKPFDVDPIETVHGLGYKASEPEGP